MTNHVSAHGKYLEDHAREEIYLGVNVKGECPQGSISGELDQRGIYLERWVKYQGGNIYRGIRPGGKLSEGYISTR